MDGSESVPISPKRKRSESNGGSDSELSEGWNIIDQTDVNNHDILSSDESGESVEVIDVEDEPQENDIKLEKDSKRLHPAVDPCEEVTPAEDSPATNTPVMPITEPEVPALPEGATNEEMFDPSFRLFLTYAAIILAISHLANLLADNITTWNTGSNVEAPSFLRDLPTTPRLLSGNEAVPNTPWTDDEASIVQVFKDRDRKRKLGTKIYTKSQSYEVNYKQSHQMRNERFDEHKNTKVNKQQNNKYTKYQNNQNLKQNKEHHEKHNSEEYNKQQKIHNEKYTKPLNRKLSENREGETKKDHSYNSDDYEISEYFNTLRESTSSFETKGKLNQVFLILDALNIGLNDLEEVVSENSELQSVLKKQKYKLSQVLTEMEYGVSKSLDRVATSVLNKVKKLERRFEQEWCELEKRGHQDELRGLFYECRENERFQNDFEDTLTPSEEMKNPNVAPTKESSKIDLNWNSYEYQVDKDSPGKEPSHTNGNVINEMDDYYTLVKSEMQNSIEFPKGQEDVQLNSESGDSLPSDQDNKVKNSDKRQGFSDESNEIKYFDTTGKQHYNKDKHCDTKERQHNNGKRDNTKEKYFDKERRHNAREKHYGDNDEGKGNDKDTYYNEGKHFDGKSKDSDCKSKHNDVKGKYNGAKEKYYNEGKKFSDKGKRNDAEEKPYSEGKHDDKEKANDGKNKKYYNEATNFDNKGEHNYVNKDTHYNEGKHFDDKGKRNDEKEKYYNEGKHYDDKRRYYNDKKHVDERGFDKQKFSDSKWRNNHREMNSEKSMPKSEPDFVRKYLKESCEKGKTKVKNLYEKLKTFIDSKLMVPKNIFDSLFAKYCRVNDDSYKWEKRFYRENPKGDFNVKNNNNLYKDDLVVGDNVNRNVRIIDITETSPEDEAGDEMSDNIIIPNNQRKQWVFSHDEPSHDNQTNLTGHWFFKAGESRSKMRWLHRRGDWWFERASHRRSQPWSARFSDKYKNWYFRRAWARHNCPNNPGDNWCEETLTVPNASANFR